MKRIRSYFKGHLLSSLPGPLFKLLEAALELAMPLLVMAIVDRDIPYGAASRIFLMALALAALGLAGLMCSVAARHFTEKSSTELAARLRRSMFRCAQGFSCDDIDRLGAPALAASLTDDVDRVREVARQFLTLSLHAPLLLFGTAWMSLRINAHSAPIFTAAVLMLMPIVLGISLRATSLRCRAREQEASLTLRVRENLSGVRVLRGFCREDAEIDAFNRNSAQLARTQHTADRISVLKNPLTLTVTILSLIALLAANTGQLTQGGAAALAICLGLSLAELCRLSDFIATLGRTAESLRRVDSILKLRPSLRSPARPAALDPRAIGQVDFVNVRLRLPGSNADLLTGLNFSIRRGQIVGIIGGTASGKSTLAGLIPRLRDASSGTVRVNGADVRAQPLRALRARISFVPQHPALFQGSIRDNLRWADPTADDGALMEAVHAAQAEDILRDMGGLDGRLEPFGTNLSESQRCLFAIARALVRRPDILILDGSTSSLDPTTDTQLRLALRQLSYRPTVFITSQRVSAVRHADRILVLDEGKLVGDGTHEQLLSHCQIYREICDSQARKEAAA